MKQNKRNNTCYIYPINVSNIAYLISSLISNFLTINLDQYRWFKLKLGYSKQLSYLQIFTSLRFIVQVFEKLEKHMTSESTYLPG